MSLYNYRISLGIEAEGFPFYALIMAAIRKADTTNMAKLKNAWPEIAAELQYRYWSGGGLLPSEPGYDPAADDNLPVSS